MDGLRLAVGTLTALPVPPPRRVGRRTGGSAMLLAPVAALPLAAVVGLIVWTGAHLSLSGLVIGVVTVTALVLGTRAMHLDGLADTADGLSASYDAERALAVMRTGDVGPSGAGAIALTLMLDAAAVAAVAESLTPTAAAIVTVLAVLLSRHALTLACTDGVPAARPDGLGALVVGAVSRATAAAATLTALVVTCGAMVLTGLPWWVGAATWAAVLAATAALVRRATTRVGGVTGDVLGAVVEISFAAALTAAAISATV